MLSNPTPETIKNTIGELLESEASFDGHLLANRVLRVVFAGRDGARLCAGMRSA